jgi:hypothetical protein
MAVRKELCLWGSVTQLHSSKAQTEDLVWYLRKNCSPPGRERSTPQHDTRNASR